MAGQQQQADNSLGPIWIMILIFTVGALTWFFGHSYIVKAVFFVKIFEAKLVYMITGALQAQILWMQNVSPADVSILAMSAVAEQVGEYIRYPIMVILGLLGLLVYLRNPIQQYRQTYSMKSLAMAERYMRPQISPVLKLDLVKTPIMEGPWAMSMSPMEFAKHHDLLEITEVADTDSLNKSLPVASLKKGKARMIFTKQLGRQWTGINDMPIHAKALFAVFGARMNRDSKAATKLIHQIAASSFDGTLDFSGTDELIAKHINSKGVQRVISRHAYDLTVMCAMIVGAREDGVMASADFLWLKPMDRALWYMLNTMGRQTPFCESAGPFNHYVAETLLGRKIIAPMVEEAVTGLEIGVSEILYRPDED